MTIHELLEQCGKDVAAFGHVQADTVTQATELLRSLDDLVMFVKRMASALRKADPSNDLPAAALTYLKQNGLTNNATILRRRND